MKTAKINIDLCHDTISVESMGVKVYFSQSNTNCTGQSLYGIGQIESSSINVNKENTKIEDKLVRNSKPRKPPETELGISPTTLTLQDKKSLPKFVQEKAQKGQESPAEAKCRGEEVKSVGPKPKKKRQHHRHVVNIVTGSRCCLLQPSC